MNEERATGVVKVGNTKTPQRTLKVAVDLLTMRTITSQDLLAMDRLEYLEVRRAAAKARHSGIPRFACALCGHSVYAPLSMRRTPLWKHNHGAPPSCEWWTGDPSSVDWVSARQFAGARESPLHACVKRLVAELLERDGSVVAGSVVVDRYLIGETDRRRPDVRATVGSRDLAFEVQLATTQIPIIVAREDFYAREHRSLVWLTWNLDTARDLPTSFWDIFHSHNRNLFSLDDEVVARSREERRFLLRVHWMRDGMWRSDIFSLDSLTWPAGGLPFAVAPELPWYIDFRRRWMELHSNRFVPSAEQAILLDEVAAKAGERSGWQLVEADVADLLNFFASAVEGRPVASSQRNLRELLHTFLEPERRHRFARLARYALARNGRKDELSDPKVRHKLEKRLSAPQEVRGSPPVNAVVSLFPELFDS